LAESLKQKTFKGMVWTTAAKFAVQGFNFIQGIILARLLDPSDFGLIAMAGVFTAISATFVDSGFSNALVRNKERTEMDYSTTFVTNVALSLFFCLLLCACSGLIADFYHQDKLRKIVILCASQLFLGSINAVQGTRLTINLDFRTKGIINVISVIVTGLVTIAMAFMGYGVWSLIYPLFFKIVLEFFLYRYFQHWFPKIQFSWDSWRKSFSFGSKLLLSSLINTVYSNIAPLIIGKKYSAADLGYYNKAEGYAALPSKTATQVLGGVTFPVLAEVQDDRQALQSVYRRLIRLSAYVVFPLMMGIAALARPLIICLITEKWSQSILYLQIVCFALMWYPVHSLNLNLLQVKGRSDLFLRLEIIKKAIGLTTLFITVPLGLSAMCVGQVCVSLISLVINTHYTGKMIDVGFLKQMKDLLPSFLYSVSMGAVIWFCIKLVPNLWVQLAVGLAIGVAYYLGVSKLTRSPELDYVVQLLKENVLPKLRKNK